MLRKIAAICVAAFLLAGCSSGGAPAPSGGGQAPSGEEASQSANSEAAQSESSAAATKKEITHWNGYTGSDGVILQEIVDRYNAENTDGVTVKMDIIPWANFNEKLPQAIATNTAPDFVLLGNDGLGNYCSQNSFQPLDDFYDVTGNDKSESEQAVYDMYTYNGQLMFIPMNVFGKYLYWNKTIFKESGLDPEKPPQTWDELFEMAIQCTDPAKNYFGAGIPIKDLTFTNHYLLANGTYFYDDKTKAATTDTPEIAAIMTKLQDLTVNKKISPVSTTGPDMDQMFFAGQIAMYINGPWCINGSRENQLDFGITIIPEGSKGRQGTLDGTGFAIPVSTSAENKALAYKFIRFWNTPEICKEWSMRNGFPPHMKTTIADPEIQNDPILSELSKSLDYIKPIGVGMITIQKINDDALSPMYENILYGGTDVASELKKAHEKLIEILQAEPK